MKAHLQCIIGVLCVFLSACGGGDNEEKAAMQAVPVTAVTVETRDVPIYMQWSGQIVAKNSVDVQARVEGYLQDRLFKEGSQVSEGDMLYHIDPQPFEEELAQTKANLESSKAELARATADLRRYQELIRQDVISRSQFDSVRTEQATLRAEVKRNTAAVETAKINLGYTRIAAPITGKIGESMYDVGALVGPPSNTVLAKITALDSVYVKFALSEKEYLLYTQICEDEHRNHEGQIFNLILGNSREYPLAGRVDMADPEINPKTGTLGVRLEFDNPNNILLPGQFATVRALIHTSKDAVVVPARALLDIQGSKSVFLVKEGKAMAQSVEEGLTVGKIVIIEKGLSKGDKVILGGLQLVRPNAPVQAKDVPYPDKEESKKQEESTPAFPHQGEEG